MDIRNIAEKILQTSIDSISRLHGGDINETFSLHTKHGSFVVKVNLWARFPEMFQKEKNGLEALRRYSEFRIPKVIAVHEEKGYQFLFLEKIEQGNPKTDFWDVFGKKLATMHLHSHEKFGWETDNFMGNRVQKNQWANNWEDFYRDFRIMPFVKMLRDQHRFDTKDVQLAEKLCVRISDYFPEEPPAFVHGDLWSGNFMTDETGNPVLIDPAVSFSHREMDLALTKLFGGFSEAFYQAYQRTYPLSSGWEGRLPVAQLYPLLFHAVAFGGTYVTRCRDILKRF